MNTPSLEGRWQPLFAELDGEEAPLEVLQHTVVELAAGRYAVRFGHLTADQGTYEIDPGGPPAQLTLRGESGPNAGRTIPCIYKFVEDTFVVCYGLGGLRPKRFTTTGCTQVYLATYRRR